MIRRGTLWRVSPQEPRDECLAEVPCDFHGICLDCGELIHLAGFERSPGWDEDLTIVAELIVGKPARCADCRKAAGPWIARARQRGSGR
jgi:hypothetical protein